VPKAEFTGKNSHDVGIVSMGSCDGAVHEALDILKRRGVHLDYMRVRSFPFGQEVEEFMASHSTLLVVEQNRDAQLRSLLTLETAVEKAKLRSILHYSGLPMSSSVIVDGVVAELGAGKRLANVS
jgi:2-oxoglutarate ferredoxin oxidoreductase subunit alpha